MHGFIRPKAPAKLNLLLHVTGKRADGYHTLESLAVFVNLCDWLELKPSSSLALNITGSFAHALPGADNLVLRAAQMLQHFTGTSLGAQMTLHKHIPIGAGLGGGSSDAAAALRGLVTLWQCDISEADLMKLGLMLGSDVPVCLAQEPTWMTGIGATLSPAALPKDAQSLQIVLVNPNVPLLTADVFRHITEPFSAPVTLPSVFMDWEDLFAFLRSNRNDLESPAIALLPHAQTMLQALAATEGCLLSRMSGSGATCFGIYKNAELAEHAMRQLKQIHPQWWVHATSFYSSSQRFKE